MPELSRCIDIIREMATACGAGKDFIVTDSSTTTVVLDYPAISNRSNVSNKTIPGTLLGEGDEIYLTDAQASSTLTAALTASATSFAVASGASFASSSARPYIVGCDVEFMVVTLSSNTFTVLERG